MKKMKKIMALVIATVMVVAMGMSAFADDTPATPTTHRISVNISNDKVTHTYKVYQIFTGTPSGAELVDLKYGSSYAGKTTGNSVAKSEIDAIGTTPDAVRTWITTTFGEGAENVGTEVATLNATTTYYDAVPGYYLVLDTAYTATEPTHDAYSAFMIKVVDEPTTFTPKKSVPSVDKQVSDNNDGVATGDNNGFGETADHKIGETFQFKLTATIPAGDYTAYDTYKAIFNDTMSVGITFENIVSTTIGGTSVTGTLNGIANNDKGAKTWTITFDNLTQVAGKNLTEDLVIEVIYNAHLNEDAVVNTASGLTTNKNTVSLTYSNNPDATGTGETDTTPEDDVWVFTYGNTGTKVDANNEPVVGAGFVLYKINADDAVTTADSTSVPEGTVVPLYKNDNGYFVYDSTKTEAYTGGAAVKDNEIVTTADGGNVFAIKGLDAGTYALYEKTVPNGYVRAKNTVFKISATHEENSSNVGEVTLSQDSSTSEDIINYTGTTLPETGGIGTTIFYVLGAILVLGAGIVLVTRRRMSVEK